MEELPVVGEAHAVDTAGDQDVPKPKRKRYAFPKIYTGLIELTKLSSVISGTRQVQQFSLSPEFFFRLLFGNLVSCRIRVWRGHVG